MLANEPRSVPSPTENIDLSSIAGPQIPAPGPGGVEDALRRKLAETLDPQNRINGACAMLVTSWADLLVAIHILQRMPDPEDRRVILNFPEDQNEQQKWVFEHMPNRKTSALLQDICKRAAAAGELELAQAPALLGALSIESDDSRLVRVRPVFDLRRNAAQPADDLADPLDFASRIADRVGQNPHGPAPREVLVILDGEALARIDRNIVPEICRLASDRYGLEERQIRRAITFLLPPGDGTAPGRCVGPDHLDRILAARAAQAREAEIEQEIALIKRDPARLAQILTLYPGYKVGTVTKCVQPDGELRQGGYCFASVQGEGLVDVRVQGRQGTEPRNGYFLNIADHATPVAHSSGRVVFGASRGSALPAEHELVIFRPLDEHPPRSRKGNLAARMEVAHFCELDDFLRAHLRLGAS